LIVEIYPHFPREVPAVVYQAFDLTPDEIGLIERATKYPYGEV